MIVSDAQRLVADIQRTRCTQIASQVHEYWWNVANITKTMMLNLPNVTNYFISKGLTFDFFFLLDNFRSFKHGIKKIIILEINWFHWHIMWVVGSIKLMHFSVMVSMYGMARFSKPCDEMRQVLDWKAWKWFCSWEVYVLYGEKLMLEDIERGLRRISLTVTASQRLHNKKKKTEQIILGGFP